MSIEAKREALDTLTKAIPLLEAGYLATDLARQVPLRKSDGTIEMQQCFCLLGAVGKVTGTIHLYADGYGTTLDAHSEKGLGFTGIAPDAVRELAKEVEDGRVTPFLNDHEKVYRFNDRLVGTGASANSRRIALVQRTIDRLTKEIAEHEQ